MSFNQPDAEPLQPLACIGNARILTKRDDSSLALYRKPGGCDKNGNPLLIMGLEFVPLEGTTVPGSRTYTTYCNVSPFVFDPRTSAADLKDIPSYQKDAYAQTFMSANGKSALFEVAFSADEHRELLKKLEGMADFAHTEDGIVDSTDWQGVAAEINAALEGKIVGYTLTQKVESEKTGEINPETGKAIWENRLTPYYELNPKYYFTYNGPDTKVRAKHKATFSTIVPF